MKTFKEYITEADNKMDLESALKMCKPIITGTPFYFNWQVKDSRGASILLGTRDVDDCVNKETGSRFLARLVRSSWESNQNAEYKLMITYPCCSLLTYQNVLDFRRIEDIIDNGYQRVFKVSFHTWEITLPIQEEDLIRLKNLYSAYNLYITTRGTMVNKINTVIEYMKQTGYTGNEWTDEDEMEYNKFKMKYLPREELTDDDYALDAAHNL